MKQLLVLAVILTFAACNSSNVKTAAGEMDLTGFETSKLSGTDLLYVFKKDENGNMLEEGFVKNGQKNGQWIMYDPIKGHMNSISAYTDGILNGYSFKISDRGYLDEQIAYKNNVLDGKYFKFRYGKPKFESYYIEGKLNGLQKEFYDNGKIQQETGFKDGVQDGVYNYYSDDGIMRMSYIYKNGEKVSGGIIEEQEENNEQ
jgi:antitoxin component YwqK of YwqJK toxin-antitoxin module